MATFALDTARVTANAEWEAQYVFGPGLVLAPYLPGPRRFLSRRRRPWRAGPEDIGRALGRRRRAGELSLHPPRRRTSTSSSSRSPWSPTDRRAPTTTASPTRTRQLFEADESNLLKPNADHDLRPVGRRRPGRAGRQHHGPRRQGHRAHQHWSPPLARRTRTRPSTTSRNLADEKSDYVASVRADLGNVLNGRHPASAWTTISRSTASTLDANANFWRMSGDARYFKIAENASGARRTRAWSGTGRSRSAITGPR